LPETPIRDKIIVLRKEGKSLLVFKYNNTSIECEENQYYALASHNFRIFIEDILQWNPFLNLPFPKDKKVQPPGSQSYHLHVSRDTIFKNERWWSSQGWWTNYKESAFFKEQVKAAETAAAAEAATAAAAAAAEAQIHKDRTYMEQQRAMRGLFLKGVYYPHPYARTTQ
jgi:hypothetical protein